MLPRLPAVFFHVASNILERVQDAENAVQEHKPSPFYEDRQDGEFSNLERSYVGAHETLPRKFDPLQPDPSITHGPTR